MKHKELFHIETPVTDLLTGRCERALGDCHSAHWPNPSGKHLSLCLLLPSEHGIGYRWSQKAAQTPLQPEGCLCHSRALSRCADLPQAQPMSPGMDPTRHSACSQLLWSNKFSSRGQQPQSSFLPRDPSMQGHRAPCAPHAQQSPPPRDPSLQGDRAQGSLPSQDM